MSPRTPKMIVVAAVNALNSMRLLNRVLSGISRMDIHLLVKPLFALKQEFGNIRVVGEWQRAA